MQSNDLTLVADCRTRSRTPSLPTYRFETVPQPRGKRGTRNPYSPASLCPSVKSDRHHGIHAKPRRDDPPVTSSPVLCNICPTHKASRRQDSAHASAQACLASTKIDWMSWVRAAEPTASLGRHPYHSLSPAPRRWEDSNKCHARPVRPALVSFGPFYFPQVVNSGQADSRRERLSSEISPAAPSSAPIPAISFRLPSLHRRVRYSAPMTTSGCNNRGFSPGADGAFLRATGATTARPMGAV